MSQDRVQHVKYTGNLPNTSSWYSNVNTFLETVAINLKHYKGKILCSASAVIPNKEPKTIIKYVFKSWISLLGLPAKFLTDNGGEFAANSTFRYCH